MTAPEDLPSWARWVVIVGGSAFAVCAIASSSIALGVLAWQAGIHDPRAWLFGGGFDLAAGVTGTAWAAGAEGSWWQRTGRNTSIGLFAASLVFNGVGVLAERQVLPAGWTAAVSVAVVLVFPPLALMFGHLVLKARSTRSRRVAPAGPRTGSPVKRTPPAPKPEPAPPVRPATETDDARKPNGLHAVPPPPVDRRAERDELAKKWIADNPTGGGRRLAAYLTEQGHPITPSGARSAYLTDKTA